jgi:hypothetical protein
MEDAVGNTTDPRPAVQSQHARVKDAAAIEALISSLPPEIAGTARELINLPGARKMRFSHNLKRAYVLWYKRSDGVFSCHAFDNIASIDQAAELWAEIEKLSAPDTGIMTGLYSKITGFPVDESNG